MKLTQDELKDLVPLARAAVGGENEPLWDQVASFFKKSAREAEETIEPKPTI